MLKSPLHLNSIDLTVTITCAIIVSVDSSMFLVDTNIYQDISDKISLLSLPNYNNMNEYESAFVWIERACGCKI